MSIQTSSKMSKGALLAVGAAALILAGCAGNGAKSASSGSATVACVGVNSCKAPALVKQQVTNARVTTPVKQLKMLVKVKVLALLPLMHVQVKTLALALAIWR